MNGDLDERVRFRSLFLDQNIIQIFQDVRSWVDTKRGDSFEMYKPLLTQFELFEGEMTTDKRDATQHEVDLTYVLLLFFETLSDLAVSFSFSDIDAVYSYVKAWAEKDGFSNLFSDTLKALIYLPHTDKHMLYVSDSCLACSCHSLTSFSPCDRSLLVFPTRQ
jgi:hypothetical protein